MIFSLSLCIFLFLALLARQVLQRGEPAQRTGSSWRLVKNQIGLRSMESQRFDVNEYVKQMTFLLDLQLRDEYHDGVVANFEKIVAIAQLVNEFPLPEEIEASPIFEP